jgi:thiol-disulfide isomerase/thioredoxin
MLNVVNLILKYIRPYSNYILIFVIIFIFIAAAIYAYEQFAASKKSENKFKDVANYSDSREKTADIYFFHVDWCPHCIKAIPEWKSFSDEYDGKVINDYKVVCHDVDCTEDSNDKNPAEKAKVQNYIEQYGIDSYPTLKMSLSDGEMVDFDAKISKSSLEKFVETILA